MNDALLTLTPDGHRDTAGYLRVHLTNDIPGKLAIARYSDTTDLVASTTFKIIELLHSTGDPVAHLDRLADGMDLGQPDEQATVVGILLLTARGNREAIAWVKAHLAFDASAKVELVGQADSMDLCESLTAILLALLGQGLGGPPHDYLAQMIDEADQFADDGPEAA